MKFTLRDYQSEGVEKIRDAYRKGFKAPLYQCPTGGGKTLIFSYIAENAASKGKSAFILVHRKELLKQASEKLSQLDVPHGLIAPGHTMTGDPVQIASVYTLARRLDQVREPDLIIVDEAHHSGAGTWELILKRWPNVSILGVTATPIRMDGKGLGVKCGGFYDTLIEGPSVRWLIDNRFLSEIIYYAPDLGVDLSGIHTVMGDFDKKEVNHRLDKPVITGCAIDHYKRICPGVPAIAFCASVKHAEHVAEQFNQAGISAASIDGTLDDKIRTQRILDLAEGRINALASCDIISEGTDIPVVGAAILLRPTKSTGLHLQQVGRALRVYPGKQNAIILDHVGNCRRHGLPDDVRSWSLNGYKQKKKGAAEQELRIKICSVCFAAYRNGIKACPQCGHIQTCEEREIKQVGGTLKIIKGGNQVKKEKKYSNEEWNTLRKLMAISKGMGLGSDHAFKVFHRLKRGQARNVA